MRMLGCVLAILASGWNASAVWAQQQPEQPVSQCLAVAQSLPSVQYANFTKTSTEPLSKADVRITFAGHSTYVIETQSGVSIATDYNGWSGPVAVPRIVTMNKAHSTHNTPNPDARIEHVLRGWNPEGGPADHDVVVEDVYVRNVPTDIRAYGAMEPDGNSIFIFEVAGLCIGHLGHLHHRLEDRHYAAIGRLDIVMVPVDGGLTLSFEGMSEITKRLYSSVVLPMHRQGAYAERFITMMSESFAVDFRDEDHFIVSMKTLPERPTIVVLRGAM